MIKIFRLKFFDQVKNLIIKNVCVNVIIIVGRGEEVERQVGRRLATGLHNEEADAARMALAADQEDSLLPSKRSSMSNYDKNQLAKILNCFCCCLLVFAHITLVNLRFRN